MRMKEENGKLYIEKSLVYFESDAEYEDGNPHTLITKKELMTLFSDYLYNLSVPEYAPSQADTSWQIGCDGKFFDSGDNAITMAMIKRAGFIIQYNPDEFLIWIGQPSMVERYCGNYEVKKVWREL